MLPTGLKALKRQVIQSIKRMIAPHVWKSGYLNDDGSALEIFCFADVNGSHDRSMGKVFNEELTCLQGFWRDGTIDALAGGCACANFSIYCLEDLLAIEQWLVKNIGKEIARAEAEHEISKEHQKYMALWHKGKAKLSWPDHLAAWKKKQNENKE